MHARRALRYWREAMTVSTVVDHNDYIGNGVTTSFPYTFRIFKKTDLSVSVVDLSGNITVLVLDTDYSVTNAGGYSGGAVILNSPLANGWQISISRELEPTQETDLRNQGKFFAEVHEDVFDKLTMLIQQGMSLARLALRKPSSIANFYDAIGNYITNLRDPVKSQDAATKNYVDNAVLNIPLIGIDKEWVRTNFYPLILETKSQVVLGSYIEPTHEAVRIQETVYPLSVKLNGYVTSINLTVKPYFIVANGVKSHLLDIDWFKKGEIHSRSYWCATDGVTSDSDCLQAMIDDIPYVSDTQTAANVYFDKPDICYLLTNPMYVYEKDYTNFIGQGAAITRFKLADGMTGNAPQQFKDLQTATGVVYDGVRAAFVVAARRRTQSPQQGYISANQAEWGIKWTGMSFEAFGSSVYQTYGIYAPKNAIGSIRDCRFWSLRYGYYSADCYLMHFDNVSFSECRLPIQIDSGTSIAMSSVSSQRCGFGYRIACGYGTLNCVTNDHWGLDNNGALLTNSYAFDLKGNFSLNGCGAEIGYGGVLKVGYGLDDANTTESSICFSGCNFIGGTRFNESNYTAQTTLADFGVVAWGYNVFNNTKAHWPVISMRNSIESETTIVQRFPIRITGNSELNCCNFIGNTNRYVDISELQVDSTSFISCAGVSQKPMVRGELSSSLNIPANNTAAVNFTEINDALNNYAGGVFTVPVTGKYRIDMSVSYTGAGLAWIGITGATTNVQLSNQSSTSSGSLSFSRVVSLTAGQVVNFVIRTDVSASSVTALSGSGISIEML